MISPRSLIFGIGLLAAAAGLLVSGSLQQRKANSASADALLSTPLPDLQNRIHTLAQYRGKVLVVNFWATWCPPCREEIPHLTETQRQLTGRNVQFVGIALDNPSAVADFAREFSINYPILIGGINEAETIRALGNATGGLPYTLIFDRQGQIREKVIGGLDKDRLERLLTPLI